MNAKVRAALECGDRNRLRKLGRRGGLAKARKHKINRAWAQHQEEKEAKQMRAIMVATNMHICPID